MMAQYLEIKAAHPGSILFYRMGDFYEMFFDDAVAASSALDIALTKRGKHDGADIPMCGVPVHAAEGYFLTLIRKGFRVAVCEQLESPEEAKKRGYKSVVKRDVVRLVTPGTLTEDSLLNARQNNFLAAFGRVRDESALAWVDISTGEVRVAACPTIRLLPEVARIGPSELLVADAHLEEIETILAETDVSLTPLAASSFDSSGAEKRLTTTYGVASLDAFGGFSRTELAALGALIAYLEITQKGKLPLLRPPLRETPGQVMQIDPATRRSLELTRSMSGARSGSLLGVIDRTVTAGGGRLLEQRVSNPSCDTDLIASRLDALGHMLSNNMVTEDLRQTLRQVPDIDRALGRISLDRAGPRDLAAIRSGLTQAETLSSKPFLMDGPPSVSGLLPTLGGHGALIDLLDAALVAEPPLLARDGGFIASGYDAELDEAQTLRDEGRGVIAGMQSDYADQTGISALKIKHNNVLGYFIETTATHADKMMAPPLSETFIHRQTTANAVRFTTVELSELETKILNAGSRALEIEKRLYSTLTAEILKASGQIGETARSLAELDVITSLTVLSKEGDWCRPLVDGSRAFDITAGRHPVVEAAQRREGGAGFVANDCALAGPDDPSFIWLITGPNMAGKSTFLRQNALIAILAQIGAYVPAQKAHIGIVSSLFSRVGASDDLARGRSTFMVEMVETAAILNQADERSLVILDEIGRGTSTYDGLSIAWATLEHLHDVNKCRALFATHYHEMTALSNRMDGIDNATVAVKEWEGEVIFLYQVQRGAADRSYGVQVAKLAGLPGAVIERARIVLDMLESGERKGVAARETIIDDLPLFSATPPPAPKPAKTSEVEERLESVLPDQLTPMDALALIYELKALKEPSA
ncbi:DNA mismatch repair protein MutS [Alphaproteobacteria bacterium KMM 3653]|uniref:DNA mismatch repair protein MutS n=1 Tax=Harenicola maris TaxID=2841044 RepID=A0AAP2CPF7_9RHOB|nr:DNA mismatch repair protein MutS [Harenicola maris]